MQEQNQRLLIDISLRTMLKVVGLVLLLWFIYIIGDILMVIGISILVAALIEPMVDWLEHRRVPRGLGVVILYIGLLAFFILTFYSIIPPLVHQVSLLAGNFPVIWERGLQYLETFQLYSQQAWLQNAAEQSLQSFQTVLTNFAAGLYGALVTTIWQIVNISLVLVLAFYLVLQRGSMSKVAMAVSPPKYHAYLADAFTRVQYKIGAWARSQLLLCVIIGGLAFAGLAFLLPQYALTLALFIGAMELIPYLGPLLGAIPAVFLALTYQPFSISRVLGVVALCIAIQELENNLIVPKVMERSVGLNPVITIIVMLIGARLAGIVGIILAVPVATSIEIFVKDFWDQGQISNHRLESFDRKNSTP